MDKTVIVKQAVSIISTIGISKILEEIVKKTVLTSTTGKFMKFSVAVGVAVIGGLLGKAASDYTDETIDEIVKIFTNIVENNEPKTVEEL